MFWLFEKDLPEGVGVEHFSAMHLVYIAVFLVATIGYAHAYKKMSTDRRYTADRILGVLVFLFGLFEYGTTAALGYLNKYTLPIHVCSLMFTIVLIHAFTNKAQPGSFAAKLHGFLGAVIFHPGFLGTWAALLFPDWLNYPFWNYLSISGFVVHGLISLYSASVMVKNAEADEPVRLFRRDLRNTALFMTIGALIMYFFDKATHTNYWYMAGPGNDSPFSFAYDAGGYLGYYIAYFATVIVLTALWYLIRYIFIVRRRKKGA